MEISLCRLWYVQPQSMGLRTSFISDVCSHMCVHVCVKSVHCRLWLDLHPLFVKYSLIIIPSRPFQHCHPYFVFLFFVALMHYARHSYARITFGMVWAISKYVSIIKYQPTWHQFTMCSDYSPPSSSMNQSYWFTLTSFQNLKPLQIGMPEKKRNCVRIRISWKETEEKNKWKETRELRVVGLLPRGMLVEYTWTPII